MRDKGELIWLNTCHLRRRFRKNPSSVDIARQRPYSREKGPLLLI